MKLLDLLFGRKQANGSARKPQNAPQMVRGRYDAAQTSQDNINHWVMADPLSADAGMTPAVRRVLRNRCRYESANNSYCRGIVLTLANDTVGIGPRIKIASQSQDADRQIEQNFHNWMESVNVAAKLRTMRQAMAVDGEAFAMLTNNPLLDGVQLDFKLIEADQIASPQPWMLKEVDGIEYDAAGNPSKYHLLKRHPGALYQLPSIDFDPIDASMMMHVYRADRPGQHRGVPELTPALPLFAMLRRYTLATLSAAETAADFAAVLFTNTPANDLPDVEPFIPLNIQPRSMMALPEGWQLGQMRAEQPTTTYGAFKTEILNEIARVINMPFNVAACNSSSYNFSSGRLDHAIYFKSIRIDRELLRINVLERLFRAWIEEAAQLDGQIPDGAGPANAWKWSWVWDGNEHIDPQAEAEAQATRLESNTTTLAAEYAKLGKDWEVELEQRARELAFMRKLDIPLSAAMPAGPQEAAKPASPKQVDDESADMEMSAGDGHKPPQSARAEAKKGLEWRRQHNRGGTAVGVARARDIANGKGLSDDTIARMASYFARHEVDKKGQGWSPGEQGYPSAGRIAWALWGGDAARKWVNSIRRKSGKAE